MQQTAFQVKFYLIEARFDYLIEKGFSEISFWNQ